MEPAVFFPVTTTPLAMRAGLAPLGTDYGNGPRDAQLFLRDREHERYRAAKAAVVDDRHVVVAQTPTQAIVHRSVLRFIDEVLRREHALVLPELVDLDDDHTLQQRWAAVSAVVQEDLAVLHRGVDDDGDTIMLNVCFPSGWRPERLRGASFSDIHGPVPDFVKDPRAARSMVKSMVERGPFVRFVWTVSADDHLDHHPDHGQRAAFADDVDTAWLRIERQVTVPFADVGGSLFLIRTFLRPLSALSAGERALLREAVVVMPEPIAAYKGLAAGRARIIALLDR